MVQWLRLCASTTEGMGLIPGWGSYTCCLRCGKKKKKMKGVDNSKGYQVALTTSIFKRTKASIGSNISSDINLNEI